MPLTPRDTQSCRMVSLNGLYYTVNGTFTEDPAHAITTERWFLQMKAAQINTPCIIIRV